MTMRGKMLRGGIALSLRQIISLPLNVAGMGLASIFLSPTDFGVLAVITVLSSLALAAIDIGTSNALIQSPVEPSTHLLRQVQLYKCGAGLLLIFLYALLSPWICRYYDLPKWMAFMWPACALLAWLQSQRTYQSIRLQRSLEWQTLARVEMAEMLIANLVLALTAYFLRSPIAFVLSSGMRMLFGSVALKYLVRRHCQNRLPSTGGKLRDLLDFGVPYQMTTGLSMVQKTINPLIVGGFAGVSAVGLVNWGTYIVSLPLVPIQPFYAFLFSAVAERERKGIDDREKLEAFVRLGVVSSGLITMLLVTLLPTLVEHVFGSQWRAAVPVASLLLVGNVTTFASTILTTYLTAKGHSRPWMFTVLFHTILICLLCGLGTMAYGLIGYASCFVAAGVIALGLECAVLLRLTGLRFSFFHCIRLLLYTVISVEAGRVAVLFSPGGEWAMLTLQVMVSLIIFVLAAAVTDLRRIREDVRILWLVIKQPSIVSEPVPADVGRM